MSLFTKNIVNQMESFNISEVQPIYEQSLDEEFKSRQLVQTRNEVTKPQSREVTDPMFQTTYCICLRLNEYPVIGTYVDAQIVPGFYYRVRRVGGDNDDYLFNGEPRQLMSVGMGYGKRVTFKGDNALDNSDFYFYSDTEQEGFAFIPAVPENKTKFCMIDGNGRLVADVKITNISRHQIHNKSEILDDTITSRLSIDITCDIDFHAGSGGYFPIHSSVTDCALHGTAVMCRSGSVRNAAMLQKIEKIMLSHNPGSFTLVPC